MANLSGILQPGWNTSRRSLSPDLAFLETLQHAGMDITRIDADGKLHRVHMDGDGHGSLNGWYVFYGDSIPAGVYGTWKEGWQKNWCSRDIALMGAIERSVFDRRMASAKAAREAELASTHEQAVDQAEAEIAAAHPALSTHPYLQSKRVRPHGIYQSGDRLIIPVRGIDGALQSVQRIGQSGEKRFMSGGKMAGGMHVIGTPGNLIYVTEGYATAATIHEATGGCVVCAFDANGLGPVSRALHDRYPSARIVLCADNDQWTDGNPGLSAATKAAKSINGTVLFPVFQSSENGPTDFNDLHCREGMAMVLEQITGVNAGTPDEPLFFTLREIRAGLKGAQYLIKPYLERETTTILFGESGTYKSFICLDIGLCVAFGIPYHGKPCHAGPVFYVCGEGSGGIARRVEAWMLSHPEIVKRDAPFFVSRVPGHLIDEGNAAAIAEVIRKQSTGINPALIIIDTLSTNIGNGDESSNPDIAKLMNNVNVFLRDVFGSCVLIVHHVGHGDKDRERGAYALRGNADCRIMVKMEGEYRCSVHSMKVKDGPEFDPISFSARPVVIPGILDSEGDKVGSIVMELMEYCPIDPGSNRQLDQAMAVLIDMVATRRSELISRGESPNAAQVEDVSWFARLEELAILKPGASRQARHKIKHALRDAGRIRWEGRNIILCVGE